MTLARFLATHDEAALEALTSKGVLRRALRDVESGLAEVTERTATSASVSADDQKVFIDGRGISHCSCTCTAGGKCRHIVMAVLLLRGRPEDAPALVPSASAVQGLRELDEADLRKFAGADWPLAATLADNSADAAVIEEGVNCRVEFAAGAASVTFIAGQGLRGAAYRGPKSKSRLMTSAAAILVRARHGVNITPGAVTAAPEDSVSTAFLDAVLVAVPRMVRSVLNGSSRLTIDTVYDLAISARAESVPRLSGQLRSLVRDASLAMTRDVGFEPVRFVAAAATTVALVKGLGATPLDTALTGSLRRHHEPRATPLNLWMMAASCWRNATGARGITFHAFAPDERTWYSATIARGAGQDPLFEPVAAYRQPLWAAGQPAELMAREVALANPLVSSDGSIAITQKDPAIAGARLRTVAGLLESGAAHSSWAELHSDVARRIGAGLRRRSQPVLAILCPARFGGYSFNELDQVHELEIIDRNGATLMLTLPADAEADADRLRREGNQLGFVCAEASVVRGERRLQPIAVGLDTSGGIHVVNLGLDHWPQQGVARAALGRLRDALSTPRGPKPIVDRISQLALRSLEAATAAASSSPIADSRALIADCEAAGLLTLARSLERLAASSDVPGALRTAYLAAEIEAAAAWC